MIRKWQLRDLTGVCESTDMSDRFSWAHFLYQQSKREWPGAELLRIISDFTENDDSSGRRVDERIHGCSWAKKPKKGWR